jgi:hypothetical protein
MQLINADKSQTLHDLALIHYGSVVYATDIAHANNLCVTDDITGLSIQLPVIEITSDDKKVVKEISKLTTPIATKYPI